MEILSDPTPDMYVMPRFDDDTIDMQELLRRLAEQVVNAVMDAEADQLCGGANSRNGYRERALATCVGTLTRRQGRDPPEGRVAAWKANAMGPALLARACAEHGITLVHVSSDYVFDGTAEVHGEEEPFSPLSVYGQTKAAGDIAVAGCPRHYIMRSSWVIGEGHNFVKTMKSLSVRVADPEDALDKITVVDDQLGRLTFTRDMAAAIFHVLDTHAAYGTYDCTGSGAVKSWAEIAHAVFDAANGNGDKVVPVSTADYYAGAEGPIAPRPVHSALDLAKLEAAGFYMPDWEEELGEYLKAL
ncbi:MAG: sugar nucleotide-binding protein [Collinsella bouchesdurhonensis]|nr:sugar nucleotide-binding protein [Collinsella bouchesdurhonensis]